MRPDDQLAYAVAAVFFAIFVGLTVAAAVRAYRVRRDAVRWRGRMLPLGLACIGAWCSLGAMFVIRSIYW